MFFFCLTQCILYILKIINLFFLLDQDDEYEYINIINQFFYVFIVNF